MIYHFGFLNDDLTFLPFSRSGEAEREHGLFHSWYELDPRESATLSVAAELDRAIAALRAPFVIMSSGSILDSAVTERCRRVHGDVRVCTVRAEDPSPGLERWVEENKYRYFLTDSNQAKILHRAVSFLKDGASVVMIGAVPALKDLSWQLTGREPDQVIASDEPNWVVVDYCKNAAPHLLQADYPRFVPNLVFSGNLFLAYLKELDWIRQGRFLRALGVRELIDGDALGRWIAPTEFLNRKKEPLAEALPVISRTGNAARFYSPLRRYYDRYLV